MATLDELLALLPDNATGEIDAADLRAVVVGIWEHGVSIEARVSALEAGGGGGSTISVTGLYGIDTTPNAVPGAKSLSCDTGDFTTAGLLRIAKSDKDSVDLTTAITSATRIFGQQKKNSSAWVNYNVTGQAVDQGSYVDVPVTVLDSNAGGGSPWNEALMVFVI